jgi:hypothetical protein
MHARTRIMCCVFPPPPPTPTCIVWASQVWSLHRGPYPLPPLLGPCAGGGGPVFHGLVRRRRWWRRWRRRWEHVALRLRPSHPVRLPLRHRPAILLRRGLCVDRGHVLGRGASGHQAQGERGVGLIDGGTHGGGGCAWLIRAPGCKPAPLSNSEAPCMCVADEQLLPRLCCVVHAALVRWGASTSGVVPRPLVAS